MVTTPPNFEKNHQRKREKIYSSVSFAFCAHFDVIEIEKH